MTKLKNPIPEEIAFQICEEIREHNSKKKFSLGKGQCWGCIKYADKKGNMRNRCIFGKEDKRGCQLVNKIFDARK